MLIVDEYLKKYLGRKVTVTIDRKMGSKHPQWGFIYPINYGYLEGTLAQDGEEVDAYIVGEFAPVDTYKGYVVAIVKRFNDVEDKLVVCDTLNRYSKDQIAALTEFQERYFKTIIEMYND